MTTPETVARSLRTLLYDGLVANWYPRVVAERGGYVQNMARDWTTHEDGLRFLVYQSRIVWTTATLIVYDPSLRVQLEPVLSHGLAFLETKMRDHEAGGYFTEVHLEEGPLVVAKSSYALSFALYALAAAYKATGDPAVLSAARDLQAWLGRCEDEHGGIADDLDRFGTVSASRVAGTPSGIKSFNTHLHLLESATEMHEAAPTPETAGWVRHWLSVLMDRMLTLPGVACPFFLQNWRALPGHNSPGHNIETAFLLHHAATAIGLHSPDVEQMVRGLVDHSLHVAWDEKHGGLFYRTEAFDDPFDRDKVWWVQNETLTALLVAYKAFGDEVYWNRFCESWRFCCDHLVDRLHSGWYDTVDETGTRVLVEAKAHRWKANYHEGRTLVYCLKMLAS